MTPFAIVADNGQIWRDFHNLTKKLERIKNFVKI